MERLKEYIARLKEKFLALPPVWRAVAVGAPLLLLSLGLILALYLGQENYTVLYTGLSPEDLNRIITELDKAGVKYKISPDGRTIYVPEDVARELRLRLASQGIPQKGIVGYEIFDKSGIALSRFQQLVNFKRAIEGELARTIMSLECVDFARVHIVLPEDSLFLREEEEAKASVFLRLKPGCSLTPEQVKAIRNLVAGSVENLKPSQVVVIDEKGRELSSLLLDEGTALHATQLKIKREFEKSLERKIQRTLESVLGFGRARVNVSAELDFSALKKREELYDPELTAIVSEQRKKERTRELQPGGVPGTEANVPPAEGRQGAGGVITERKESITNYEVSKREVYYEDNTLKVKRISVGVVVDSELGVDTERIKSLVIASAGLDPSRGDRVTVVSLPFFKPAPPPPTPRPTARDYATLALFVLALLALVAFGIWRLLRRRPKPEPQPALVSAPPREEEKKDPYEELLELAKSEPRKVALVIKKWLKES
ncbi:MAG: flagellar M-ring protein FliF [Aquificae bacterium]|nr:flagellar M-ring protein FliF [Aquificota bacterium]